MQTPLRHPNPTIREESLTPLTTVTLGISKYASEALGDVIYVELPETGLEVGFDDAVGAVESVKSASDINTPFAGKVVEANSVLEEKPGLLNQDPEGEAWIAKLEVDGAEEEFAKLMDSAAYKTFTEESS
jgi:glycine cleavage system H protein